MDMAMAIAKVAETEGKYRLEAEQFGFSHVREENHNLELRMGGKWYSSQLGSLFKSFCATMGVSSSELGKYPVDAQVFSMQAKLRNTAALNCLYYNGHPVAVRNGGRAFGELSRFLGLMHDWKGWGVHKVDHDPVHGKLHARLIYTDKVYEHTPNDVWFPGLDMWQDFTTGKKLENRAVLFRQVCSNGMVVTHRAPSLEGRYNPDDPASFRKAIERMSTESVKQCDGYWNHVQSTGKTVVGKMRERGLRLNRMLGVKTKAVLDSVAEQTQDSMPFYDIHNMYTFAAQRSELVEETRNIQARAARMVAEVASMNMMPYYDALFGAVGPNVN